MHNFEPDSSLSKKFNYHRAPPPPPLCRARNNNKFNNNDNKYTRKYLHTLKRNAKS